MSLAPHPIELTIENMAYGGKGVARHEGKVYFVADTLPGDQVMAQVTSDAGRYADAVVLNVITPSLLRGPSPCPYDKTCGGCQWQGVDYEQQLEWKRSFISQALKRIGKIADDRQIQILPSPSTHNYRNRILVRVHVDEQGQLSLGYFRRGSRELVAITRCAIAAPAINEFLKRLLSPDQTAQLEPGLRFRMEIQEVLANNTANLVITVYPSEPRAPGLKEAVAMLNADAAVQWAGLVFDLPQAPVVGYDRDYDLEFLTLPGQFQQINIAHNHNLRRIVKEAAESYQPDRILDVFCGGGNLSLPLADGKRYIEGIESNKKSIICAKRTAAAHHLTNVNYLAGDATKHLWKCARNDEHFDLVILDPPREGMYEGLIPLKKINPRHIIYVSCDPTTLARDLAALCRKDEYVIDNIIALDFFPNTYHVETVVFLSSQEKTN